MNHLLETSKLGTIPQQDRSETHTRLERCNPRIKHLGHTFAGTKEDSFSDSDCEKIIPEFLDLDADQALIGYLNKLNDPDSFDDFDDWSDDNDLFMEGLSNPEKIEELWEKSKAKKLQDDPQYNPTTYKQDYLFTNTASPDDSIQLEDYMGQWCNTAHQRVQFPDSPTKPKSYSKTEGNPDDKGLTRKGETPNKVCVPDSDSTQKTETYQNSSKDNNINRGHLGTYKIREEV